MVQKYNFIETDTKELFMIHAKARALLKEYFICDYRNIEKRNYILKQLFGSMGKNVSVDLNFFCDFGKNIFIGDNVVINANCTFIDNEKIVIGNKVLIAPNVQIYTAYHPVLPEYRLLKDKKEGTIKTYLKSNNLNLMYSSNDKVHGKLAITHYKIIKENDLYSLLDVHIDTGRKNQIRVAMNDMGHTIIGDDKYGEPSNPLKRLGLHAYRLKIKHPFTNKIYNFESKIPNEFLNLLKK